MPPRELAVRGELTPTVLGHPCQSVSLSDPLTVSAHLRSLGQERPPKEVKGFGLHAWALVGNRKRLAKRCVGGSAWRQRPSALHQRHRNCPWHARTDHPATHGRARVLSAAVPDGVRVPDCGRAESEVSPTVSLRILSHSRDGFSLKTDLELEQELLVVLGGHGPLAVALSAGFGDWTPFWVDLVHVEDVQEAGRLERIHAGGRLGRLNRLVGLELKRCGLWSCW